MDQSQLVPPVSPVPQPPLPLQPSNVPQGSSRPRTKLKILIPVFLVIAALLVSGLVYYFKSTAPSEGADIQKSGLQLPNAVRSVLHLGSSSQGGSESYTTDQVEGYFENDDSSGIIAFIKHQLPDATWISGINKPVRIILSTENQKYPEFEANRTTEITNHADLCKIVSSEDCQHLDANTYYVFMNANLLKTQPFVKVALVVSSLRTIYDKVNPQVASQNGTVSCSGQIIDTDSWEAKFWLSLTPEQKAPLEGFDNSLIARESKRAANYQTNTIEDTNLVSKHCTTGTSVNQATPSAKQHKGGGASN